MTELVLLIGLPIAVFTGVIGWKFGFDRRDARESRAPIRRREDARDWQRRFGSEGLPSENFFPPTQNEVLETLYILDHLTPRWESGDAAAVESVFLDELARNFPTLRKAGCLFPLASHDGVESAEMASRREAFRAQRAHVNALDQIMSRPVAPGEITPVNARFGRAENKPARMGGNLWPVLLGSVAVLVAVALGGMRFFPGTVSTKRARQPIAKAGPAIAPVAETPVITPTPAVVEAISEATPTPPPVLTVPVVETKPVPVPSAPPSQIAVTLQRQIAASKQRAVSKYPALAVEGSEINLRFVFRYKNLVQENSPRLLDPKWPEELVEECAAAAGTTAKRDGFTRVLGTPR